MPSVVAARQTYDAVVIGAGDVGAAIARELARFDLRVAIFEAACDVGAGTSKANTAILHTGYDAKPGTAEASLVARGHALLTAYAGEVGIPLERTGALVVAWSPEQLSRLAVVRETAARNGYRRIGELTSEELYRREPHLGPGALGALEVPDEYVVCPWTPPLAWSTQAVLAGVELLRGTAVARLERLGNGVWRVESSRGTVFASWVLNAAGLYSDEVHRLAGYDGFTVTPRRGELVVFDKLSRPLLSHIVLPVPTSTTKGVLVAPTVFGNLLVGPTAVDVTDKENTDTTPEGLAALVVAARGILPELGEHEVTATYAGLRAATEHGDYQLVLDGARGYACAGGIRSTGLTSAMAIAEWLRDGLVDAGLVLRERPEGLPLVRMPNVGEATLRPYADAERIDADPEYGRVVCFCERVTRGEIRDAYRSPIPPRDLDGLRRRTRALMGRCQGFFCAATVAGLAGEYAE